MIMIGGAASKCILAKTNDVSNDVSNDVTNDVLNDFASDVTNDVANDVASMRRKRHESAKEGNVKSRMEKSRTGKSLKKKKSGPKKNNVNLDYEAEAEEAESGANRSTDYNEVYGTDQGPIS